MLVNSCSWCLKWSLSPTQLILHPFVKHGFVTENNPQGERKHGGCGGWGNQILMRGEIPHFPKLSFSYNFPQLSWARRCDKNKINISALPRTLNREMQEPDVHGFQKHREER